MICVPYSTFTLLILYDCAHTIRKEVFTATYVPPHSVLEYTSKLSNVT